MAVAIVDEAGVLRLVLEAEQVRIYDELVEVGGEELVALLGVALGAMDVV